MKMNSKQSQEKVKRLELLTVLTKDILAEKDNTKMLQKILDAGLKLVNAKSGNIRLVDKEKDVLRKICSTQYTYDANIEEIPIGKGVCGVVVLTGDAKKEDDAYKNDKWRDLVIKERGEKGLDELIQEGMVMRSEISAPLKDGDITIGTIDAHKLEPNGFSEEDLEIFEDLAILSGIVLKRKDLQKSLDTIKDIVTCYSAVIDVDLIQRLDDILTRVLEVVKVPKGAIAIEKTISGNRILDYVAVRNVNGLTKGYQREIGKGIMGEAARDLEIKKINDVSQHIGHIAIDPAITSEMVAPMIFENRLIGILMVASIKANRFDDDDNVILHAVANAIGMVISNIILVKEKEEDHRKMETELIHSLINFSGMMAHHIKTPLMGIQTHSSVLKDKLKDNDIVSDNINSIYLSINKISSVIRKIFDFTKSAIAPGPCNLHTVMDEAVSFIKEIRHNQDIKIIKEYDKKHAGKINLEYFEMQQVFINIIDNAFKAMSEKGGTLTLKTTQDSNRIRVVIADTGVGIADENRDKVFKPLFTTDKVYGTGLGLSICKRFVEAHNGSITYESERGRGTQFIITLPLIRGGCK